MSSIAEAICGQLTGSAGVTNVIGDRVFPSWSREADNVYPLAVYDCDQGNSLITNTGSAGLSSTEIKICTIGQTYASADAACSAIVTLLDGAKGTWDGVVVQGVFLQDDGIGDDIVYDAESEEILFYVKEARFLVWFQS